MYDPFPRRYVDYATVAIVLLAVASALIPIRFHVSVPVVAGRAVLPGADPERSLQRDVAYSLDGEWYFVPGAVISPDTTEASLAEAAQPEAGHPQVARLVSVPGIWNDIFPDGRGYGSYLVTVDLSGENGGSVPAELFVNTVGTAATIYVNGRRVGSFGQFSVSSSRIQPANKAQLPRISLRCGENTIIFHVSNDVHPKGGLWEPLIIGPKGGLSRRHQRTEAFETLMFGSLIFTGIFQLLLFALRSREYSYLYFGLSTILIAVGNIVRGTIPVFSFVPELDYMVVKKAQFALYYLAGFFFLATLCSRSGYRSRRLLRAGMVISLALTFATVVLPFRAAYRIAPPFYPVMMAAIITMIHRSVVGERYGLSAQPGDAGWNAIRAFAFGVLLYGITHDFLSMARSTYDAEVMPVAAWIYAIFVTVSMAREFVRAQDRFEEARRSIVRVAEAERQSLGRDLHDGQADRRECSCRVRCPR